MGVLHLYVNAVLAGKEYYHLPVAGRLCLNGFATNSREIFAFGRAFPFLEPFLFSCCTTIKNYPLPPQPHPLYSQVHLWVRFTNAALVIVNRLLPWKPNIRQYVWVHILTYMYFLALVWVYAWVLTYMHINISTYIYVCIWPKELWELPPCAVKMLANSRKLSTPVTLYNLDNMANFITQRSKYCLYLCKTDAV